ncbi:YncE family protein [Motilibacter aurantiacus]|uniref:YncE family protein n=1 Tax=Motilibacter aurantiacus TaxID=2714955 RepID=UPI00140BF0EE|nr:YncE family protein [Motilibacter aurantiacus]NHC45392.1 YncE family protein [Motilibacter aurantiacus]
MPFSTTRSTGARLRRTARIAAVATASAALAVTGLSASSASAADGPVKSGSFPVALGVYEVVTNPYTGKSYVASGGTRTNTATARIQEVDTKTGQVTGFIESSDTAPYALAINPVTNTLYTGNTRKNSVSVYDLDTNTEVTTIELGVQNRQLEVDTVNNKVYVTEINNQRVAVIDGATNTLEGTFGVGPGANAMDVEYDPATKNFYVVHLAGDVTVIDGRTKKIKKVIALPSTSQNISVDPKTGLGFVTGYSTGSVSVIDTKKLSLVKTVDAGNNNGGLGIDLDEGNHTAYFTNQGDGTLWAIDTATGDLKWSLPVGPRANTPAVDTLYDQVFVTNKGDDTVAIVKPAASAADDRSTAARVLAALRPYAKADTDLHKALKDLERALSRGNWTTAGDLVASREGVRYLARAVSELRAADAPAPAAILEEIAGL